MDAGDPLGYLGGGPMRLPKPAPTTPRLDVPVIYCWLIETVEQVAVRGVSDARVLYLDATNNWTPDAWGARRFSAKQGAEDYVIERNFQNAERAVRVRDHMFMHTAGERS